MKMLIFLLVPVVLFLLICGIPYPYFLNNHRLNQFAEELNRVPLPPNTVKIGKPYKIYGNLADCSNSGGYLVAILLSSNLEPKQIKGYYKDKTLSQVEKVHAWGVANKPVPIYVDEVNYSSKNLYPEKIDCFYGLSFHLNPRDWFKLKKDWYKKHLYKNLYAISVGDAPYEPDDIRCH